MDIIDLLKHQQIFMVAGAIQLGFLIFVVLSFIVIVISGSGYLLELSVSTYNELFNKRHFMGKLKKMVMIFSIIFIISIIGERTAASFKNVSKVIILEYNPSYFEKIDKIDKIKTNN